MTYIYIYDEVIKTEINSDDQILWKNIQSVHLFERANNIYLDEQNKKLKYLMINKNSISWEIKTQNQSKCNWTTTEVDHGQTQPHTHTHNTHIHRDTYNVQSIVHMHIWTVHFTFYTITPHQLPAVEFVARLPSGVLSIEAIAVRMALGVLPDAAAAKLPEYLAL